MIKSRVQPLYFSKHGNHLNTSYLRVQTSYLFSNKTVRLSSLSSAVFTVKLSFIQSGNNFNEVVAKIPEVAVGMFTIISYKFTSSKDLLTLLAWEARSPLPSRNTSDFENLRLEFEDPIPQGHNNFKTRQDLRHVSIKHYLILYHTGTFAISITSLKVGKHSYNTSWSFKRTDIMNFWIPLSRNSHMVSDCSRLFYEIDRQKNDSLYSSSRPLKLRSSRWRKWS